jgi:hypothetical protein
MSRIIGGDLVATVPAALPHIDPGPLTGTPPDLSAPGAEARLRDLLGYLDLMDAVLAGSDPPAPYQATGRVDDPVSGFRAATYFGLGGGVVVAFAGTEPGSVADLITDLLGAATVTRQDTQAIALARTASTAHPGLVFVGHSLGGRLAAEASIVTRCPAVTLNAAGVSEAAALFVGDSGPDAPGARERVLAYQVAGDILSVAQDATRLPDAFGVHVLLPNPGTDPIDSHGIAAARAAIGMLLGDAAVTADTR